MIVWLYHAASCERLPEVSVEQRYRKVTRSHNDNMPVLKNKIVWKSIEALHDEAIAKSADTVGLIESSPTAINHEDQKPNQPLDTSDGDVTARIDKLLEKLDENEESGIPNDGQKEINDTVNNASEIVLDHKINRIDPKNSVANDMSFAATVKTEKDHKLVDIAAAIQEAQQIAEKAALDKGGPVSTIPSDMSIFSSNLVDEVRRTVSLVIASEIPRLVHQAVGEAIRETSSNDPKAVPDKKVRAKRNMTKKIGTKKTGAKKTSAKKTSAKKTGAKKTPAGPSSN